MHLKKIIRNGIIGTAVGIFMVSGNAYAEEFQSDLVMEAVEAEVTEAPQQEIQVTPEPEVVETEAQTEPQTEAQTESETISETESSEAQTESSEAQTETEAAQTESASELQSDMQSESTIQSESASGDLLTSVDPASKAFEDMTPEEQRAYMQSISPYKTNNALYAAQNIHSIPIEHKSLFRHVDGTLVIIKSGANIYEEKSKTSKVVGVSEKISTAYALADFDEEWVFIESGDVRGFIHKDDIATSEVSEEAHEAAQVLFGEAEVISDGTANAAALYTYTTTKETDVDRNAAISKESINIYDSEDFENAEIVGTLEENGIAFILEDGDQYYIESGYVRGFADKDQFYTGDKAEKIIGGETEECFESAKVIVEPEDNKAFCYSMKTTQNMYAETRREMVRFAKKFLGTPYVWGGTSLTGGCDCSGYVQSLYENFGYSLDRMACDQAVQGDQVPVSEARPGDLIFFASNGYVYHVSMYIGHGEIIHAKGRATGVTITGIGSNAVWASSFLN